MRNESITCPVYYEYDFKELSPLYNSLIIYIGFIVIFKFFKACEPKDREIVEEDYEEEDDEEEDDEEDDDEEDDDEEDYEDEYEDRTCDYCLFDNQPCHNICFKCESRNFENIETFIENISEIIKQDARAAKKVALINSELIRFKDNNNL